MAPNIFSTGYQFCGRQFFDRSGRGDNFGMIQAHYIHCALYFCDYYISSTSDRQAFYPRLGTTELVDFNLTSLVMAQKA